MNRPPLKGAIDEGTNAEKISDKISRRRSRGQIPSDPRHRVRAPRFFRRGRMRAGYLRIPGSFGRSVGKTVPSGVLFMMSTLDGQRRCSW